jgi:hypothetical protein
LRKDTVFHLLWKKVQILFFDVGVVWLVLLKMLDGDIV